MRRPSPSPGLVHRTARGREAESLALDVYLAQGYRLRARNARVGPLELDLVLERGGILVVVEVRSRRSTDYGHPAATIDARKRARLRAAAARWVARHADDGWRGVRFDVVAVVGHGPNATLTRYESAF